MLLSMKVPRLSGLLHTIVTVFAISLITPTTVIAQSNTDLFDTKLDTTVTVSDTGQSRIKHEFLITNKTPTTFISQYGLKISSDQLENITVVSNGQDLQPEIVKLDSQQQAGPGQTSIGITFPDKIVGEGKFRKFTISYTNPDAAIISGSVLEVALPPQANPQDYSRYSITLITPDRFGGPIRTTPENPRFTVKGNQVITTFDHSGGERGMFALFGSVQIFDLDIKYHLNNPTNNPGIAQIALPPDTTYQKMHYQHLEPKPKDITQDKDGNWIATYHLPGGTDTVVDLQAVVRLNIEPNTEIPVFTHDDSLLKPQEFWPVNHADIKKIATNYQTAKEINDYVVETLQYNTQKAFNDPTRMGAITALNSPDQVVCQEFTDLFVTLARAVNIPARRITGYAHSQNSELRPLSLVEDVLHAWPEYYDSKQKNWVPIDPTWEDTTGGVDYFHQRDLNHIVFAINGQDSQTPYSAGSYKKIDSTEKTVFVDFGTQFPLESPQLELELVPQKLLGMNLPGYYSLQITNTTGQAHYHLPIALNIKNNSQQSSSIPDKIETILPFQTLEFPLKIKNDQSWWPTHDTIELSLLEKDYQFDVITSPPIQLKISKPNLSEISSAPTLALAGTAIIFTLILGSLLVFKRRK
jgi:hypothetical protein